MAAEYLSTWNPIAKVAAHNALVTALGATASVSFHSSDDTELARVPLDSPAGAVNGTTGELLIEPTQRDESTAADGSVNYASLRNSSNVVLQSLPCQEGTVAVSGSCVVNTLTVVAGGTFELVSWSIL